MALAAEDSRRTFTDASRVNPHSIGTTSLLLRAVFALSLMAIAANCFLKYLWWAACYSAWSGLPKFHEQWKAAGANASLNGWSGNRPGTGQPHPHLHCHPLAQSDFLKPVENHIARSCLAHNNHRRNWPSGLGFSLGQTESLSNSVTSYLP